MCECVWVWGCGVREGGGNKAGRKVTTKLVLWASKYLTVFIHAL